MDNLIIETKELKICDQEGKVLCEGDIFDIYYSMCEVIDELKGKKRSVIYTAVGKMFTDDFQPESKVELSWGTALKIAVQLKDKINEQKKTTDDSLS
jgi:hypothetical protein